MSIPFHDWVGNNERVEEHIARVATSKHHRSSGFTVLNIKGWRRP